MSGEQLEIQGLFISSSVFPGRRRKVLDYIVFVFAQGASVLTTKQIVDEIVQLGYLTKNERFEAYVRRVLKGNSMFVEKDKDAWVLQQRQSGTIPLI